MNETIFLEQHQKQHSK